MYKLFHKHHYFLVFIYLFLLLVPPFYKIFFQNYYLLPKITNVYGFLNDPVMLFYPWRKFAFETIINGNLPLWNPYIFCGTPFIANPQSAVFYPLNILFLFFSTERAYTIVCLLQLLLAGYFTYLYLTKIKLSKFCALLGAQTFMLCGYFIAWLEITTFPATVMWIPLVYYFLEVLFEKKKFLNIIPLALILSITIFAGHSQLMFYVFLVSLLYVFVKIIITYNYKDKLKIFFYVITAIIFVVAIALINLLPTFEFSTRIFRSNEPYNLIMGLSLPALLNFILPSLNPIATESVCYIGILVLILLIFSLNLKTRRINLLHFIIFLFCLLFACKTYVYKFLFFYLPFTSRFRMPQRIIGIMIFSLITIAVTNLNYLLKARNIISSKTIIFILISINFIAVFFILYYHQNIPLKYFTNFFFLLFFYSLLIIFFIKNKIAITNFKILLLVISLLDLLIFIKYANPDTAPQKYIFPDTASLKFLQDNVKLNRIARFNTTKYVLSNSLMPYHIYDFQGCDSFIEISFAYFSMIIARQSYLPVNFVLGPENLQKLNLPILNFTGMKYIISQFPIENKNYELEFFDKNEAYIYRNKNVLPRAYLVNNYKYLDFKKTFVYLSSKDYNPEQEIVLNDFPNFKLTTSPLSLNLKNNVKIISYENNTVKINYFAKNNSLLVLSDMYYPGWQAFIDGKETKIYRSNICFRSIYAPLGKHQVIFKFLPFKFYLAGFISYTLLILIIIFIISSIFINKYKNKI